MACAPHQARAAAVLKLAEQATPELSFFLQHLDKVDRDDPQWTAIRQTVKLRQANGASNHGSYPIISSSREEIGLFRGKKDEAKSLQADVSWLEGHPEATAGESAVPTSDDVRAPDSLPTSTRQSGGCTLPSASSPSAHQHQKESHSTVRSPPVLVPRKTFASSAIALAHRHHAGSNGCAPAKGTARSFNGGAAGAVAARVAGSTLPEPANAVAAAAAAAAPAAANPATAAAAAAAEASSAASAALFQRSSANRRRQQRRTTTASRYISATPDDLRAVQLLFTLQHSSLPAGPDITNGAASLRHFAARAPPAAAPCTTTSSRIAAKRKKREAVVPPSRAPRSQGTRTRRFSRSSMAGAVEFLQLTQKQQQALKPLADYNKAGSR